MVKFVYFEKRFIFATHSQRFTLLNSTKFHLLKIFKGIFQEKSTWVF